MESIFDVEHPCIMPDCPETGIACYHKSPLLGNGPIFLCEGHMRDAGYCWCCGQVLDDEPEEFTKDGVCRNCWTPYAKGGLVDVYRLYQVS